jgi:hypothetical protein
MALGEFTKQIAQQAILSATSKEPAPPPAPGQPDNVAGVFFAQIQGMQKALKEDEELVVHFGQGPARIRVVEMFAPSSQVIVLIGTDPERNVTRVITAVESLQLTARVAKVQPGSKPLRVALITPKKPA